MTPAEALARRLGGTWNGTYGLVPGPGHSRHDRSVKVTDGPGGIIVHSFAGEDWRTIKDAWRQQGLIEENVAARDIKPAYGLKQNGRPLSRMANSTPCRISTQSDAKSADTARTDAALSIWRAAQPAAETLLEDYLLSRGITLLPPPSLRFAPSLKYAPSGISLPCMVAGVQAADKSIQAIHRTYLCPTGRRKAQVSQPRLALGSLAGGAVRLAPAAEMLALVEGIEDGLALMQMTGSPAWAVLGTSGFKNFAPPPEVRTIVLASDADAAGDALVNESAARFAALGLAVMRLRPPEGTDWCDVLADVEERAAIMEFDGGATRKEADLHAWAEMIGGRMHDAD